jgi:hypothetical protein
MILRRKAAARCLILRASLSAHILSIKTAYALNGPQFIGFFAESTALVGADHFAVADTAPINTNSDRLVIDPRDPIRCHRRLYSAVSATLG